ncbi:unnamed protein product [Trichogramma brassicae]|uniref:Uncharacterized protein n=1 Tax=Trichogramma brassicae TaxID=86971 RepID=A0A6H5IYA4_9HYME|nr:unnamed protein product [Trichogramma brassicae]
MSEFRYSSNRYVRPLNFYLHWNYFIDQAISHSGLLVRAILPNGALPIQRVRQNVLHQSGILLQRTEITTARNRQGDQLFRRARPIQHL